MVLSRLFKKRSLGPGKLTRKEKYQIYSMNPELNSLHSARYMYYNAKNLPESVIKRKEYFKQKAKKEKEISKRTKKMRDISKIRKSVISNRKTTESDEYGSNIIELGTNDSVGSFLNRVNISTRKTGKGLKNKKTRRNRK